jgi:ribose transport system permease protein
MSQVITKPGEASSIRPANRTKLFQGGLPVLLLVVTYVFAAVVNPRFLAWDSVRIQLTLASFIGLIGIGQTLAILIGQIDLSVPWNLTFSAILATNMYGQTGSLLLATASAVGVGLLTGIINAIGVAFFRIHSLIWTISMNLVLQGVTLVYANTASPSNTIPAIGRQFGGGSVGPIPGPVLVWFTLTVIVIVVLTRTKFGREVYALGNNELATLMSGVRPSAIYFSVFAISGLCASMVGILLTGFAGQTYLGMGDAYLLIPIAAVVLGGTSLSGGTGGYLGTFVGSIIVVLLDSVLVSIQISQGLRQVFFGLIILAMMLLFRNRLSG